MAIDVLTDTYRYDPDYHRMADFLGVDRDDRNNIKMAQKISLLTDWATWETGKDDLESLVEKIEELTKSEGINDRGRTLVDHLYQKIRIHMDKLRQAKTEMDKRIKQVEAIEKLESERKDGKEWRQKQDQIKSDLAKQNKVSKEELDKYVSKVEKERPDFENKMKAKEVSNKLPKPEYV